MEKKQRCPINQYMGINYMWQNYTIEYRMII